MSKTVTGSDYVMTPDDFRQLALTFPGAIEASHMRHPDFRVGKRIFASLGWPDNDWGMVKLTPEQQDLLVNSQPNIFQPVKCTWGVRGSTNIKLTTADETSVKHALSLAWQNVVSRPSRPGDLPRS